MTVDMKQILLQAAFAASARVPCRKRKVCHVGSQLRRAPLWGLEGWAPGQASENDFQDTLQPLATGAATSAMVREVAGRRVSPKSRREDATVAVITAMTIVIAVAIIAVGVWNVASGHGCDSFLRPVNGWPDAGMLHLALLPLSSTPSVLETGQGHGHDLLCQVESS